MEGRGGDGYGMGRKDIWSGIADKRHRAAFPELLLLFYLQMKLHAVGLLCPTAYVTIRSDG